MEEDENYWSNLEKIFVHNVYERISSKYDEFLQYTQQTHQCQKNESFTSSTSEENDSKNKFEQGLKIKIKENKKGKNYCKNNEWPKVRSFLLHIEPYSLIADVGCGEGKYLNVNSLIFPIGSDRSVSLSHLASYRNTLNSSICNKNQIVICDNLSLPFRSSLFDAVISIGVIHHLSTVKRRIKALKELSRILKPGGKIMICVWAMEQRLRKFKSQDVLVPMLNLSSSNKKSRLNVNLRRDLSNNSAANSEDSNDETFPKRFNRTLSLNSQKNDSVQLKENENIEKKTSDTESLILDDNSLKKTNFVDSLKKLFSQKVSNRNLEGQYLEKNSTNPVFSKAKSLIEESNTIENYKKIIEEHKDLLPKNFTIRKFPDSSCKNTFYDTEDQVDQKSKSELSLSISSLSASSASSVNQWSPANNPTYNFSQSKNNYDSLKPINDKSTEERDNFQNKRFYHVFQKNELDNLIREFCPELIIYESYYDHGNWSICARKEKIN